MIWVSADNCEMSNVTHKFIPAERLKVQLIIILSGVYYTINILRKL